MALTKYPYLGKFEGELALAPLAYEASFSADEEYEFGDGIGYVVVCRRPLEVSEAEAAEHGLSAEDLEFARKLAGFTVHTDNYGFVSVCWYLESSELQGVVDTLEEEQAEYENDC